MKGLNRVFLIFVLFFSSCHNQPLAEIDILKEDKIGWEEKTSAKIRYSFDKQDLVLSGAIKCRGGLSSRYWKHSYALELDKKHSFCGLPKDDDWILNASYIDKTFMRHKISYDLFSEMGKHNLAPRSAFAEIYLNGKYEGLFVLMEEVNAGMVGLKKRDSLAMIFKDPPVFNEKKLKWVSDSMNYYQQKFPDKEYRDMSYMLDSMRNYLLYSSEKDFAKNFNEWFDVDNIIDWHLLILLSNNGDGVRKNFYLYKLDHKTPFRLAIWDYDHSFGRDGDNEMNMMEREPGCERAIILRRLLASEIIPYKKMLAEKYFLLRKEKIFSVKKFERYIIENDRLIGDYVDRNFQRWPLNDKWYYDDNDYQQELEIMRTYMKMRLDYLDDYFLEFQKESLHGN